jgi:predicted phage terminase large subunit-like protein
MPTYRDLVRIVVAVDPAMTSGEHADETGIIVAGRGVDGCGYVLEDLTCRLSPEGWARRVVNAYREFEADRIVAEVNNGGDLVESVIRTIDRTVSYVKVHASRGKRVRAEPISSLYEQGKVFHVKMFPELEDQMCTFVPDDYDGSPDRLDALVWAMTDLFRRQGEPSMAFQDGRSI